LLNNKYTQQPDTQLTVVIFGIPEKERVKRDWLRMVLRNLDFTLLQRSAWIGKNKIPKELLEDIHELNMDDYVEIFSVYKSGSLKRFKK
jgi:DNA-binding transcriptional regulator PaaX